MQATAESFEWHMAQVVKRYFGEHFLVTLTGGSRDGGVDVWVQRRGDASKDMWESERVCVRERVGW